ncbi:MAG: glutamate racemase [Alphaproteobacteria bacterium]
MSDNRPIGVFDSGIGGVTVLRALHARLPFEDFLYLGDTARLPYGTKSAATVAAYALQAAKLLVRRGVKFMVIACNTASSVALEPLALGLAPVPVIGVVQPGAAAGVSASRNGHIAVIATEGTVRGGAYVRAIHAIRPDIRVSQAACTLFVALAEEGWVDGPIFDGAARRYLDPLFTHAADAPDTLVLGCTHFPALAPALAALLGPGVRLVDSALTTADAVADELRVRSLLKTDAKPGRVTFMVTDSPERFVRLGPVFFGAPLDPDMVETVDL